MVPQIVFSPNALGGYFPEPDFWQGERSANYPNGAMTSGITMPPVHAIAARRVLENAADPEGARTWLAGFFPRLLALHEYFYRERDPLKEGLVYIRHPWESGLDNSPVWDLSLSAIESTEPRFPSTTERSGRGSAGQAASHGR